jgi:glucose-1-phosphate thymidylyltransferase
MPDRSKVRKGYREIIGLVPAGGKATRIAPLPCSKELYPIGFRALDGSGGVRPKVVCHYLLEKFSSAGATKTYIILRPGKWDIPSYFGDGTIVNIHLAYLMVQVPFGAPYTLDQAYAFVKDAVVVFGFPDILFEPNDAFVKLLDRQVATGADVVLGLFSSDRPQVMDMVEVGKNGQARAIVIQPSQTELRDAWIIAVWTPAFTRFLHEYLQGLQNGHFSDTEGVVRHGELSVGQVFQVAIKNGLRVQTVRFPEHAFLDIGTPENLLSAVCDRRFS